MDSMIFQTIFRNSVVRMVNGGVKSGSLLLK